MRLAKAGLNSGMVLILSGRTSRILLYMIKVTKQKNVVSACLPTGVVCTTPRPVYMYKTGKYFKRHLLI